MKCNVCGSKKTELLTSWACDTCDFGSKTPVADHILGFDKGTDVQRLRQQEVLRGGPDRSLWDDLNKEYSGAEGLANDKPLYNPDRSLWDTCKDEDISEAESNAMARYAFGLGDPAPVEAVRDFLGKRYEPEEAARLRAKYPLYLDEPLHGTGLGESFPRFAHPERFRIAHKEYEWDLELESVPANPLSDDVAPEPFRLPEMPAWWGAAVALQKKWDESLSGLNSVARGRDSFSLEEYREALADLMTELPASPELDRLQDAVTLYLRSTK